MYYLKHNDSQRWYWIPPQKQDELLVMVVYDSHPNREACCNVSPCNLTELGCIYLRLSTRLVP